MAEIVAWVFNSNSTTRKIEIDVIDLFVINLIEYGLFSIFFIEVLELDIQKRQNTW